MSNQEFEPKDQTPVSEQIPHSGVHGFEKPVRKYDKTPLVDAVSRDLLKTKTPDTIAPLFPEATPVLPEVKKENPKMSRVKKLGLWAAGGLLVGGGGAAYLVSGLTSAAETPQPSDKNTSSTNTGGGETNTGAKEDLGTVLTSEQLSALDSGDTNAANEVYDKTIMPNIEASLNKLIKAKDMKSVNLSSVTTDYESELMLQDIATTIAEGRNVDHAYVCSTAEVNLQNCEAVSKIGTEGEASLYVMISTKEDFLASNAENRKVFNVPFHVTTDPDNTIRMITD